MFIVKNGRKYGFTLVELLISISLIGLLVAIMMPSLGRARSSARQVLCQTRLRQWGVVFYQYAAENQDNFPHIDGRDRCPDQPVTSADRADYYSGWVDVLPPLMGEIPWRDHAVSDFPDAGSVFQCPSAKLAPLELYSYRPTISGYFSYAMNSCLELDENCRHHPEDTTGNMPSFLKTSLIRCPEQVVLLFDQLLDPRKGFDGKRLNRSAGAYCGSYPKAFSARHAKSSQGVGGSILYCDNHVEWQSSVWKDDWPKELEVPPREDADWYPY